MNTEIAQRCERLQAQLTLMASAANSTRRLVQEMGDDFAGVRQAAFDATESFAEPIAEIKRQLAREREALQIEANRIHEHRMSLLLGRTATIVLTERPPPSAEAAPDDIPRKSMDCGQAIRTFLEDWGRTAALGSENFAEWLPGALKHLCGDLSTFPQDALSKAVRRFEQMPENFRANALEMMLEVEGVEHAGRMRYAISGTAVIEREWRVIGLDLFPPSEHSRVREMLERKGIPIQ